MIKNHIYPHSLKQELQRREGYWQHELMTFEPWGLNTRDEVQEKNYIKSDQ